MAIPQPGGEKGHGALLADRELATPFLVDADLDLTGPEPHRVAGHLVVGPEHEPVTVDVREAVRVTGIPAKSSTRVTVPAGSATKSS